MINYTIKLLLISCYIILSYGTLLRLGVSPTLNIDNLEPYVLDGYRIMRNLQGNGLIYSASIGDVNGAGGNDIVYTGNNYEIFIDFVDVVGSATPTVSTTATSSYSNSATPSAVSSSLNNVTCLPNAHIGDFNGDGLDDILISCYTTIGNIPYTYTSSIYLIFGSILLNPSYTLTTFTANFTSSYKSIGVFTPDLNGDSVTDIMIISKYGSSPDKITLILSGGAGYEVTITSTSSANLIINSVYPVLVGGGSIYDLIISYGTNGYGTYIFYGSSSLVTSTYYIDQWNIVSPSPTKSAIVTPSNSASQTRGSTPSSTPSKTSTQSITASITASNTVTPTKTVTPSTSGLASMSPSKTPTKSRTPTKSPTTSSTPSSSFSNAASPSSTSSKTPSNTASNTATSSSTPSYGHLFTPTATVTSSPSISSTSSNTISSTPSTTASNTKTPTTTSSTSGTVSPPPQVFTVYSGDAPSTHCGTGSSPFSVAYRFTYPIPVYEWISWKNMTYTGIVNDPATFRMVSSTVFVDSASIIPGWLSQANITAGPELLPYIDIIIPLKINYVTPCPLSRDLHETKNIWDDNYQESEDPDSIAKVSNTPIVSKKEPLWWEDFIKYILGLE